MCLLVGGETTYTKEKTLSDKCLVHPCPVYYCWKNFVPGVVGSKQIIYMYISSAYEYSLE